MIIDGSADNVEQLTLSAAAHDRAAVDHIRMRWSSLALLPMAINASAENKSLQSYISHASGLSPAHISTQGLSIKRSSKLDRVHQDLTAKGLRNLTRAGVSQTESKVFLESLPKTPLSAFVATISRHIKIQLPFASSFAAMLDDCCIAAEGSLSSGDLNAYRIQLSEIVDRFLNAVGMADDSGLAQARKMTEAITYAQDWHALKDVTDAHFEDMYIALLCAIDVEWTAHYFPGMKPSPTFHWLFPRVHPDMDPQNSKRIKRNVIVHPTRKLLEFCWAIASYFGSARGCWPKKAPQPKEIARDCGLAPKKDTRLRKLMSGLAHATEDEIIEYWDGMFEHLGANAPDGKTLAPAPWIILTLWMQQTLIKSNAADKSTTVFVQSSESYVALWDRLRSLWSDRLPQPGTTPWPAWMSVQSPRPDWVPSSQSSGRSSSPRDCQ